MYVCSCMQKNLKEYVPNEKGMGTFLNCLKNLHILSILKINQCGKVIVK